jgi:putative methyltransferase (TIGR04325 family)
VNGDRLRHWVRELTPPALLRPLVRLARTVWRRSPEWEYAPHGFARGPAPRGPGWNDSSVVEAYRSKLPAFRAAMASTGPIAYDASAALDLGTPNVGSQNTLLIFAHALLFASWGKRSVSVLDWGGGFGYYAFVARAVLPEEVELDYHVKELPTVSQAARAAVPEVTFWDDDVCFERTYDLVFASSSMQYAEDWQSTLRSLAVACGDVLLLTRVPIVAQHASFVVLQRAHRYRFDAEYSSWVFNRDELLSAVADADMTLVREFVLGYTPRIVGAPEQDETRAFLFRR